MLVACTTTSDSLNNTQLAHRVRCKRNCAQQPNTRKCKNKSRSGFQRASTGPLYLIAHSTPAHAPASKMILDRSLAHRPHMIPLDRCGSCMGQFGHIGSLARVLGCLGERCCHIPFFVNCVRESLRWSAFRSLPPCLRFFSLATNPQLLPPPPIELLPKIGDGGEGMLHGVPLV